MSSIMLTFSCWLNFSALDYLLKSTNPKWLEGLTFYTAHCCITFLNVTFFLITKFYQHLSNIEMHCYVSQTKDFTQPLKVFSHLLTVTFEWHLPWHLGDMPGSIKAWCDECSSWMTMTARDDIREKELIGYVWRYDGPTKRRNACVSSSRRPDRTFPRVRPNFAVQSNFSHIFDH